MAGIYEDHFAIIRNSAGREEVAVGIGLSPKELGELAGRLARSRRSRTVGIRALSMTEDRILVRLRQSLMTHLSQIEMKIRRQERLNRDGRRADDHAQMA